MARRACPERVIAAAPIRLEAGPGAPEVWLLDATTADLDEAGLRSWARQLPDGAHAAQTSRSYRDPYGLVACGSGPVGVDLERVGPFDPEFLDERQIGPWRAARLAVPEGYVGWLCWRSVGTPS